MKSHTDLQLPSGLEGLADLALDLRWTVRLTTDRVWELLDPSKQIRGNSAFIYRGGKPVMSVSELKEGSDIEVMMKDGAFVARVGEIKKD